MNTDFFGTIDRTSYFSNLNAGVKLIVSFTLIIAALIVRDPLTSGILFALELLGFILVGFRPVNVLARFWPILIAVITTGWSVAMLSAKSGTTILDLGFNTITTDSAAVGAAMMIRSSPWSCPPSHSYSPPTPPTSAIPSHKPSNCPPGSCSPPLPPCASSASSSPNGTPSARHDAPADSVQANPSPDAPKPSAGKASPCSCRLSAAAPASPSPWRRAASAQANAPGLVCRPIRPVTCT